MLHGVAKCPPSTTAPHIDNKRIGRMWVVFTHPVIFELDRSLVSSSERVNMLSNFLLKAMFFGRHVVGGIEGICSTNRQKSNKFHRANTSNNSMSLNYQRHGTQVPPIHFSTITRAQKWNLSLFQFVSSRYDRFKRINWNEIKKDNKTLVNWLIATLLQDGRRRKW